MADRFTLFAPDVAGLFSVDAAGLPASTESPAVAFAVWTLRTPYGACAGAPDTGTRWDTVKKTAEGAETALREVLRAALQWIVAARFARAIDVQTERTAARALRYTITITEPDGSERTLEGTA